MRSDAIGHLALALSKAQGIMEGAAKSNANPFFKSKYADLASVWDACRQPLSLNELAVVQTVDDAEANGRVVVETILIHSSGEWISGRIAMKPVKDDPQGIGSAITYARRYGLQSIVGIAPEDDDGNAASGNVKGRVAAVAVTTEDIHLEAPVIQPAQRQGKGPVSASKPVVAEDSAAKLNMGPVVTDAPAVTTINLNKQRYLHRAFREALPESVQPHSDKLLGDWLNSKGFVKDGKPSTRTIEDGMFEEVVKDALAFASGLK